MSTDLTVRPGGGQLQTVGFGQSEIVPYAETAARAVAEREKAAVQARYIVAHQNRRNIEQFRVELKKECQRPGFAAVARYSKPQGNTRIEGPSIRFVEAALRCYRNIFPEVSTVYDDDRMRICRVVVVDLEANTGYATEVQIQKTVERRGFENKKTGEIEPPKGREVLGERVNTYGDPVYICVATDDEVITKQNALISKAIRTQGLRLLPGDIVEEMQQIIVGALKGEFEDANKREAAIKAVIDGFAKLKIQPIDIEAWAGKPIDRISTKEWNDLREIGQSIRDGESTWDDEMREKNPSGEPGQSEKVAEQKIASLRGGKQEQKPEPPKQEPPPDTTEYINEEQHLNLLTVAADSGWSQADINAMLKQAGIENAMKIPAARYADVVEVIRTSPKEKEPAPGPTPTTRRSRL